MKKLNIIYEDKELLVVEKESHLLTIATEKRESRTLYNEIENEFTKSIKTIIEKRRRSNKKKWIERRNEYRNQK